MTETCTKTKAAPEADALEDMYLLFHVEDAVYGIEARYVRRIVGIGKADGLPKTPGAAKGAAGLCGGGIPMVNMRAFFGKPEGAAGDRGCIVVVAAGEKEVGLVVDALKETRAIEAGDLLPAPIACGVKGVARLANNNTAVLFSVTELLAG